MFLPISEHGVYCDLNEVAEDLEGYEDYIAINGFSYREDSLGENGRRNTDIIYRVPTEQGKRNIKQIVGEINKEVAREIKVLEIRRKTMEAIRDFIKNKKKLTGFEFSEAIKTFSEIMSMSEDEWKRYVSYIIGECREYWPSDIVSPDGNITKIDDFDRMPDDKMLFEKTKPVPSAQVHNSLWERYQKAIQQTAILYLSLNADLLSPEIAERIEDCTGLYGKETDDSKEGEELKWFIGKFMDSQTFQ